MPTVHAPATSGSTSNRRSNRKGQGTGGAVSQQEKLDAVYDAAPSRKRKAPTGTNTFESTPSAKQPRGQKVRRALCLA